MKYAAIIIAVLFLSATAQAGQTEYRDCLAAYFNKLEANGDKNWMLVSKELLRTRETGAKNLPSRAMSPFAEVVNRGKVACRRYR
jgi:hypothetical protein